MKTTPLRPQKLLLLPLALGLVAARALAQNPPSIAIQPQSQTVLLGTGATFTVTATGAGPFSYQWQFNGTNLPSGIISAAAGTGRVGYSGDGGAATNALLNYPYGVAMDNSGNLIIADTGNFRVRKVDTNGVITTLAGHFHLSNGDGGQATNANIGLPFGVAVDISGNLFILDQADSLIRKVDTNGVITTVAGTGRPGASGDGGPATNATFVTSYGFAVDSSGNLYIADAANSRVRKVDTKGVITTVAGVGQSGYSGDGGVATNAKLSMPQGMTVDSFGNLFIADTGNNRVRRLDTNGVITTVAGGPHASFAGDGGPATNASLSGPTGLALDSSGNLYIADYNNNRVRQIDPNGIITTVAGSAARHAGIGPGDGGPGTNAVLLNPSGLAIDSHGNLYVVDNGDSRVRRVALVELPSLTVPDISATNAGDYQVVVTSPYGSVTSAVATLALAFAPAIISQPADVTVAVGGAASFGVAANGTPPFTCAWYRNSSNVVQTGTNFTLSLENVTLADGGGYTVTVANPYASATSRVATLFTGNPPAITNQPASQTVAPGSSATFDVGATGGGLFNYQWRFNGTNVPNDLITTVAGGSVGDDGPATNAFLNNLAGVAMDAAGNIFIAEGGHNRVRKVDGNGVITTVAGTGASGFSGDGGAATNAALNGPTGVAVDASGELWIADYNNNCVRRVDAGGVISTVAGNGAPGYSGDGGAATNASLNGPFSLAFDASGNLFISDSNNQRIRMVGVSGFISTVAGNGVAVYSGDGGFATNASLYGPLGVAVDASGNLFIADGHNQRVREVDIDGVITSIAGNGATLDSGDGGAATNAGVSFPSGLAFNASGDLFISELGDVHNRIRKVDLNGVISTVAGGGYNGFSGDGGSATNASLDHPHGLAIGPLGVLLIADTDNGRVREVHTNGIIATVAGRGPSGFSGDGGAATEASLWNPYGMRVDAAGNLFIVDDSNNRVRKVDINGVITTLAGNATAGPTGDGGAATNASLHAPVDVAGDGAGNLYIADYGNNRVRHVDVNGIITTVAGNGSTGDAGNGGAATNASLQSPDAVALDAAGNLFVGDADFSQVRRVGGDGIITLVAGNGFFTYAGDGGPATNASLFGPVGLAIDGAGDLLIADSQNQRVRLVNDSGIISTVAGNGIIGGIGEFGFELGTFAGDGGPAANAGISIPTDVKIDAFGDFFIVDQGNNRVRRVDAAGVITTVAGNGAGGFSGDGGAATNASLSSPARVAVDIAGNLYISDTGNNRVRKVALGGFPGLTISNASASSAGEYQVVITSLFGSVTSAVATLSLASSTNQNAVITMSPPLVAGNNLQLGFNLSPRSSSSFTLLQTASLAAPWTTNTSAVLTTNAQNGGYQFSLPVLNFVEFYQVRSP
jgi:sugar lactone lactonase YvrE